VKPQLTYRYPQGLYVDDADLVYRLTPGFNGKFVTPEYTVGVAVSSQGLREDRDYGPKTPGTFRILVVGDSFTMAHSVEAPETFVKVLERQLAEHAPPDVHYEVLNAGVPGYNTVQEMAYLKRDGLALNPDLVILAFFVGNDIADNAVPADHVVVRDGYLVERKSPGGMLPDGFRLFLARHSHLYHLLWPYQRAFLRSGGLEELRREQLGQMAIYATADDALPDAWARTNEQLEALAALRKNGRMPAAAIAVIPDLVQVAPQIAPVAVFDGATYDVAAPERKLLATARRLALPAVDLLPAFQAVPAPENLYFPQDRHLTVAGNVLVGRALADFVVRDRLVPAAGS
jgi:hypothetical protein